MSTAHALAEPRIAATGQLRIPTMYEGWPGIANGGYLVGLFARALGGTVEVTLRRPTPVAEPLWLHAGEESAELRDDQGLVIEASRSADAPSAPPAASFDQAVAVRERYRGFEGIPFPTCFVCGPDRTPDDALRIFPGALRPGRVAAPWVPSPAIEGAGRAHAAIEHVVAALDCPGAWAIASVSERLSVPMLLGRMTVQQLAPVVVGLPHVVVGEARGESGRKRYSATAVYDLHGALCAVAHSIWFPTTPQSPRRGT